MWTRKPVCLLDHVTSMEIQSLWMFVFVFVYVLVSKVSSVGFYLKQNLYLPHPIFFLSLSYPLVFLFFFFLLNFYICFHLNFFLSFHLNFFPTSTLHSILSFFSFFSPNTYSPAVRAFSVRTRFHSAARHPLKNAVAASCLCPPGHPAAPPRRLWKASATTSTR